MKVGLVGLAGLLAASTLAGQTAGLTAAEADSAIAAAKQREFKSLFVEARGRFAALFSILLQGPVGRTMDLARDAFESYKPLKASDVPEEVRAHAVTLTILKYDGGRQGIKNVVIMASGSTSRDDAIQPLRPAGSSWQDARPRTWRPRLVSMVPSGEPVFYRFAAGALPPGDLQIIVAMESGEERYTVKAQERDRIR